MQLHLGLAKHLRYEYHVLTLVYKAFALRYRYQRYRPHMRLSRLGLFQLVVKTSLPE